ncbi:AAA family ATPase [Chryseobacterium turcicum]|uniref:AAA family ATPase n=1 Tax=Chryseobacterium turcicum TaxID=2898076 RepID=A0A9Q3V688_9FLAO|nr:AAA family ATPase [Chryseobacterium turcicum]MCD1118115.1 AAA family ATPase [Chryseobacterium turcicum]
MIYSKFKEVKNDLINYVDNNQLKFISSTTVGLKYLWLTDLEGYFDDSIVHFEVIIEKGIISVDVHFENKHYNQELFNLLKQNLPANISVKKWQGKAITHNRKFDISTDIEVVDIIKCLTELYEFTYPLLINRLKEIFQQLKDHIDMEDKIKLLQYKKQIILQGPPGTGKTREAKLIANKILLNELNRNSYFGNNLVKDETVFSIAKNAKYTVKNISENNIELEGKDIQDKKITKSKIIDFVKAQNWDAVSNGNDRGAQAVAYHLYQKFLENQFKIIQFHPSYTYDDFVRGIVAKPDEEGNGLVYDAENKILAKFAKEALINFYRSSDHTNSNSIDIWIDKSFEDFKNDLDGNLNDEGYVLSEKVNIFKVRNKDFLYGKDWKTPGHLKFEEFKNLIKAVINQEIDLASPKLDKDRFVHSNYRFTYYGSLLKKFFEKYSYKPGSENVDLKNYVLVIDEINRANVSSVLGELIYALEYRGEEVESMYEVNNSQKLILPPNLYIIGTMNTADRSVGHIDYAIRRRFAFVDVLPKELDDDKIVFHKDWFKKVSELFIINYDEYVSNEKTPLKRGKTLSAEFRPEDVWIGHSYFIQKKLEDGSLEPDDFRIRIDYEIKPILLEYAKDGVLTGKVGEITVEDYIKSL